MLKGDSGVFKPEHVWCVNDSNLPKVLESISAVDDIYKADTQCGKLKMSCCCVPG